MEDISALAQELRAANEELEERVAEISATQWFRP